MKPKKIFILVSVSVLKNLVSKKSLGIGIELFGLVKKVSVSVSENLVSEKKSLGIGLGIFGLGKKVSVLVLEKFVSDIKSRSRYRSKVWSRHTVVILVHLVILLDLVFLVKLVIMASLFILENLAILIILVNLVNIGKSYDDTDTLPGSCPLRKYIQEGLFICHGLRVTFIFLPQIKCCTIFGLVVWY